jgi:hypothetical protein
MPGKIGSRRIETLCYVPLSLLEGDGEGSSEVSACAKQILVT